jgi:S-adenosylmethionine hydrolase
MLPSATIVDVTHEIDPFNVAQAGFTLKNCYQCFPQGTIHIIAVDTIESTECPHVVVKAEGQYFISTDNGIFSHILDGKYDEAYCIDVMQDSDFFTFATRDRFAKVAVMIANGEPFKNSFNLKLIKQKIDRIGWADYGVEYSIVISSIIILTAINDIFSDFGILQIVVKFLIFIIEFVAMGVIYKKSR